MEPNPGDIYNEGYEAGYKAGIEELEKAVEETKKAIFSGNVVEYKCKFFKISDSDAWNFIQWDTSTTTNNQ